MKLYVASSWRNEYQQDVVEWLRHDGHEVYDFRNPKPGDNGFHWSEIDSFWREWSPMQFRTALGHPIAQSGFQSDFEAMQWAEGCVLVLPSGRSAHLEAGWFCGAGRPVWVYMPEPVEPELMYRMTTGMAVDLDELTAIIEQYRHLAR